MTINDVRDLSVMLDQLLERLDKASGAAATSRVVFETARHMFPERVQETRNQYNDLNKQYEQMKDAVLSLTSLDSVDEARDAYYLLSTELEAWVSLKKEASEARVRAETIEQAGLANVEDFKYDEKLTKLHQAEKLLLTAEQRVYKAASKFTVPAPSAIEVVGSTLSKLV